MDGYNHDGSKYVTRKMKLFVKKYAFQYATNSFQYYEIRLKKEDVRIDKNHNNIGKST